jgi:ASC-1-like (ASCH) protein
MMAGETEEGLELIQKGKARRESRLKNEERGSWQR